MRLTVAAILIALAAVLVDQPSADVNTKAFLGPVTVADSHEPSPHEPSRHEPSPREPSQPDYPSRHPVSRRAAPPAAPPADTQGAPAVVDAPAASPAPARRPTTTAGSTALPARGDSDEAAFKFAAVDSRTGLPARFNPCAPIHYVVNTKDAPGDAVAKTQVAAQKVTDATGVTLVFDGVTSEPPVLSNGRTDRASYQPARYGASRWAPVLVAWTSLASAGLSGYGGFSKSPYVEFAGHLVKNTGQVLVSTDLPVPTDLVLMHEFGHLMGLDHATNPRQIMWPGELSGPPVWGKGDLAGLRQLGRAAGCLSPPPPH